MKQLIVDSIQCLFFLPPIQSSNFQENSDIANKPSVTNANVLTCINFCLLGQSVIPVEQWPMQLFVASIIPLSFFPTGAAPWTSEKYYRLLELFSGYFRAPISNELYGVFFSILVSICVNCPSRINWTLERCDKMYRLGSNIIRILEQHYGCELDPKAALSKGSLLLAKLLLLPVPESEKEAESTWQALKSLKYNYSISLEKAYKYPTRKVLLTNQRSRTKIHLEVRPSKWTGL